MTGVNKTQAFLMLVIHIKPQCHASRLGLQCFHLEIDAACIEGFGILVLTDFAPYWELKGQGVFLELSPNTFGPVWPCPS